MAASTIATRRPAPRHGAAAVPHRLIPPPEPPRIKSAMRTVWSGPASGRAGSVLWQGRALGMNASGIRAYMLWILFETLWPVLCAQFWVWGGGSAGRPPRRVPSCQLRGAAARMSWRIKTGSEIGAAYKGAVRIVAVAPRHYNGTAPNEYGGGPAPGGMNAG